MRLWSAVAMLAWTFPVLAQSQATPADLPPTEFARQWIEQDPAVQEARQGLSVATHTRAMLTASPSEWTTKVAAQRRRVGPDSGVSNEWHLQLERPIRINGKADLDRQLGALETVIAEARVGEAVHETARALLELWIDGRAAIQTDALLQQQLSFAQANLRSVVSRKKAGDASAREVSVAAADVADVERQASLASTNLAKARAKLRVRFAAAQLPAEPFGDPQASPDTEAQWLQRVLDAADLLRIAEAQLRRAEITAARATADRVPDPTIGVFAASEAFRNERIVGLSISIPLGGTYRNARMRQTLQDIEVARAALERQRRAVATSVAETYADASGNLTRWRLAEAGAEATGESARLTQRAYVLGEADLQTLLLARRQLLDASRAALDARADALRANYRLLVDAHLVWDLAHD